MRLFVHASPHWRFQLLVLVLLALVGTLPFWITDLDLRAAAIFYHPEADDPWFESREALWLFFYQAAPLLVGLVTIGSLLVIGAGSIWARFARLRLHAIFLLATALLGPGLMVNAILKDHTGRPRPHQTLELGGTETYLPPLVMGEPGQGKSFPCGHSSAGYMLGAFFLIWRRRRPQLAYLALAGSIVLGTLLGIGRMSAGDHYLSDIIWSAVIAYGLAFALYYFVLRVPQREDRLALEPPAAHQPPKHPLALAIGYGLASAVLVFGVLLATPVHQNRSQEVIQSSYDPPPRVLRLLADEARISLVWHDWPERSALILLKGRGFGLPGTRVRDSLVAKDGVLTFEVQHSGVFTEKDTSLVVGAVARDWDRIEIQTQTGDIRVQLIPAQGPELELSTKNGQVLRDTL
ncbi:phosphatase PAP2 family protein [Thiocystis violacea]|uniref:phosphatase PAP2 family protein n=1 Tax=Thiocystis violacea TaxID=13725 RepID=UPI0030B8D4C0